MNTYRTTLFQGNSAAVYSFAVYLNAHKVPQDSDKFVGINRMIAEKSTSNIAQNPTDLETSEINAIYVPFNVSSSVEQLFNNASADVRMCVGLNKDYVIKSIMNCDMFVSLETRGADGDSYEIAGFASVNIGEGFTDQDITNPEDSFFNIDVICGDLSLRGTGFSIMRFLKSIIAKQWYDVGGNPFNPNWYGIYLESVNVPNTMNFYKKNNFICLNSCSENDDGLLPHYWGLANNLGELESLSEHYGKNHNLSYINLIRDKDAMDWMYTGGKKTKTSKQKQNKQKKEKKKGLSSKKNKKKL
uniref:Uncharacterized protein n=1 Tax=viral metagenome TaxID=1070528 RepID=A0A6C0I461_9ZZZZ